MEFIKKIQGIDIESKNNFQNYFDSLMKPKLSLGKLETIGSQIAGIKNNINFELKRKKHFVFASDNGVQIENISSCPKEYTRIVSESMLSGSGAISILCKIHNVDFYLIDVGIDGDILRNYHNLIIKKFEKNTKNIKNERAFSIENAKNSINSAFEIVKSIKDSTDIVSCGEMGIGNTTTSGAIIHKILGSNLDILIGRGAGLEDTALENKKEIVKKACNRFKSSEPLEILSQLGGYDIAFMTGFYLACAFFKIPVILDGYISIASALLAYKFNPLVKDYFIPSHLSDESGMKLVLEYLNLEPMLFMDMRLGEGTGAILAYPILDSIIPIYKNMKTKDEIYKKLK